MIGHAFIRVEFEEDSPEIRSTWDTVVALFDAISTRPVEGTFAAQEDQGDNPTLHIRPAIGRFVITAAEARMNNRDG